MLKSELLGSISNLALVINRNSPTHYKPYTLRMGLFSFYRKETYMNVNENCYKCGYQKSQYTVIKNGITEKFCFRCIAKIKDMQNA